MSAATRKAAEPCVRDRLLEAADRLFYESGIQAVGIDRVIAEAGAAKASLYAHFRGKDDLIAAYASRRAEEARAHIEAFADAVPPAERAERFFDWVVSWAERPDFRGCPLLHVVSELHDAEHPARAVVVEQRAWIEQRFHEWVRDAGVAEPEAVVGAMWVLFDGAIAASALDGAQRARDARWLARRLLQR